MKKLAFLGLLLIASCGSKPSWSQIDPNEFPEGCKVSSYSYGSMNSYITCQDGRVFTRWGSPI